MQWLDTEQSPEAKDYVEWQARCAADRWQRMKHEEQMEEKRRKDQEEIRKRIEAVEREAEEREGKEHEADRERKHERARRAKEAGPEAIRKGKYPRCT